MKKSRWPGRVLRGLRPDRNPLRRKLDRVETLVFGGLLVAAAAVAPVAAIGAGHWAYDDALRVARVQQATIHQERAVLLASPGTANGYTVTSMGPARAEWSTPAGKVRTGLIEAPATATKGEAFTVWVDQAGDLASPPITVSEAADQGTFATVMAIVLTLMACLTVALITRLVVNRRRLAAWEADWVVTAPKWNRQHW
jgi:hypothetical protein